MGEDHNEVMIFEKWDLNLDVHKLQEHLRNHVLDKEISRQSTAFGGWSVLSGNGDFKDGWQQGHLLYKEGTSEDERKAVLGQISKKFSEYTLKTEICTGYLASVIEKVRSFQLAPSRARIICLTAGQSSSWHRDEASNVYAVRLHIPIETNEFCFFETRDEREHIPADGSAYFVSVNREHRVVNRGQTDRFHLVMDVRDTVGVSKFHRFADFNSKDSGKSKFFSFLRRLWSPGA
jgi:hypothetical protein